MIRPLALLLLLGAAACKPGSTSAPGAPGPAAGSDGGPCRGDGSCDPGLTCQGATCAPPGCTGPGCAGQAFSFVVFGDLNGGACERNARVQRLVARMAAEPDIAFYLSTGDLIDGWTEPGGGTSCFGRAPAEGCGAGPDGNLAALLAPLTGRTPAPGLASSFYPAIGNHDDNWGSGWYPDPCGGGICDLVSPAAYLGAGHEAVCSLDPAASAHSREFYYSFTHQNSTFIVLRHNDDYDGMLACNGHADCVAYCSDPAHFADPGRTNDCYSVAQFDWLRAELLAARARSRHVIVVGHAPLLGSGDNHGPGGPAAALRALLEASGVVLYLNGHNHAYERTHPVRGAAVDAAGTTYVTVGPGGALTDGVNGAWFTAASHQDWASYGDLEANSTYTVITVDGGTLTGRVHSLSGGSTPVDTFTIAR